MLTATYPRRRLGLPFTTREISGGWFLGTNGQGSDGIRHPPSPIEPSACWLTAEGQAQTQYLEVLAFAVVSMRVLLVATPIFSLKRGRSQSPTLRADQGFPKLAGPGFTWRWGVLPEAW